MKLTKTQLREIIREEIQSLHEDTSFRSEIEPYVKNNMYYPPHNLGYSRINMPQIEDDQQYNFFKYLSDKGVKFFKKSLPIKNLKPAQKDLRTDVAANLMKSNPEKLKKPILISSDMYLMDGHHRWLALMFDNPSQKLNVISINIPGKKLLDIIKNFDKVQFKSSD
jgi:hypothetical protein